MNTVEAAAQAVIEWYDRDGSVGMLPDAIEALRAALTTWPPGDARERAKEIVSAFVRDSEPRRLDRLDAAIAAAITAERTAAERRGMRLAARFVWTRLDRETDEVAIAAISRVYNALHEEIKREEASAAAPLTPAR